ncbi:hypothetical protein HGRIS_012247 [Hohenbuehelia grisea]|uniref:Mitochondrial distribution and morphology protein 12 n=1 Tax=Hohenbuehelia grisea TaxID=104357 RepID=A0ABR3IRR7_9AGAR
MSIDLEWSKLDASLSSYLVQVINRQLSTTSRPSFIGPVEVTSFDFGSASPDVELIDLRDIYRDFLEDDEDDEASDFGHGRGPVKVTQNDDEEGYEWVSRRAAGREELPRSASYQHHLLPPHIRDMPHMSSSMSSVSYAPRDIWNAGMSLPSLADFRAPWPPSAPPIYRSPTPATPFSPLQRSHHSSQAEITRNSSYNAPSHDANTDPSSSQIPPKDPPNADAPPPKLHPNLQVHLHVHWPSDLRITLTTSLLINYPSPMFMSLPIKLSVIGLVFDGELAVAYEGERRRVHVCILDELDPYGPACDRAKRDANPLNRTSSTQSAATNSPDVDDAHSADTPPRPAKPLPIGQRLLPSIYIESEIGQADKHVLKNVTRVERFIQDVIRRTVEEELVFPNFHTLVMGDA